ncbi:Protoheme IX farnesyltransferase, mitochondrial [Ceratocystis pirilliformis]|uniref:Protoheme IX farnesyltransferase, mitochondrial n=1 Tax=Ceratocystis pirilliformis TaxID=259994 RepID=A0ABR3ZE56_9PEZI
MFKGATVLTPRAVVTSSLANSSISQYLSTRLLSSSSRCTSKFPVISPPNTTKPESHFFNTSNVRLSINNHFALPLRSVQAKAQTRLLTQTHASLSNINTDAAKQTQYTELPPHRRRQLERRKAAAASSTIDADSGLATPQMPPDASSLLTTKASKQPQSSVRRLFSLCMALSKPRLTVLVVLTAMVPYALYPVPAFLSPTMTDTPSLSTLTLTFLTTGTFLCSASANTLNMLYEPKTDALMTRTRNRPLVRGLLSARAAVAFAVFSAFAGSSLLYYGVNPTVALLGASNIAIYAGIYTPLKAITAANTWVGAVVGGIPPLMGWAAAAGENATGDGSWKELLFADDGTSLGGWLLASLLFAWQFPHFMALSWSIREEYKSAGLRMLSWTNPARNARVALRYSLIFFPICWGLCAAGVTDWSFTVTSTPINGWLAWQAMRFWKEQGYKGTARGLFWASVWHLPGLLVLALAQKKGMWSRIWNSITGKDVEGDDEWEDEVLDTPVSGDK